MSVSPSIPSDSKSDATPAPRTTGRPPGSPALSCVTPKTEVLSGEVGPAGGAAGPTHTNLPSVVEDCLSLSRESSRLVAICGPRAGASPAPTPENAQHSWVRVVFVSVGAALAAARETRSRYRRSPPALPFQIPRSSSGVSPQLMKIARSESRCRGTGRRSSFAVHGGSWVPDWGRDRFPHRHAGAARPLAAGSVASLLLGAGSAPPVAGLLAMTVIPLQETVNWYERRSMPSGSEVQGAMHSRSMPLLGHTNLPSVVEQRCHPEPFDSAQGRLREGSGRGLVDPGFPPPRFLVAPLLGMTCSMANWYNSRLWTWVGRLKAWLLPASSRSSVCRGR